MIAALWKNDVRHWLIWLNAIAFTALAIYVAVTMLSRRRAGTEEKLPANLTPSFDDDALEGRRLERVQGWALIFAAIVAVALPLYWLREPTRQDQATAYFNKASVARGATLFANSAMPAYNAAVSLQCANCHGTKGEGGVAPTTLNGQKVNWKAPPLNSELLRFSPDEVTQIITYGRPGTPMQAWGVEGGGPKNDQSIQDLVAYINSIQITPAEAKKEADDALAAARSTDPNVTCPRYVTCPAIEVAAARSNVAAAQKTLADKRTAVMAALKLTAISDADLKKQCTDIGAQVDKNPNNIDDQLRNDALACGDYITASNNLTSAQSALSWSLDWQARRANVSDGQILFEYDCARCHTEGWSVFDPTAPPTEVDGVSVLGLSGGGGGSGGGTGFNLRDGGEMRRFGDDISGGFTNQVDFVTMGSEANKGYGILGIGSGRMPGFGSMLSEDQIKEIVSYERYCISNGQGNYNEPIASCVTGTEPRVAATTTTTVKSAGGS